MGAPPAALAPTPSVCTVQLTARARRWTAPAGHERGGRARAMNTARLTLAARRFSPGARPPRRTWAGADDDYWLYGDRRDFRRRPRDALQALGAYFAVGDSHSLRAEIKLDRAGDRRASRCQDSSKACASC